MFDVAVDAERGQVEIEILTLEEPLETLYELQQHVVGVADDQRARGVEADTVYHALDPCGSSVA